MHARASCLDPATPVLLVDGRHRRIDSLELGARVVGTARSAGRTVFVETIVLGRWGSQRPAYRVLLGDGTTLVASGHHRFLTTRGWRRVRGAPRLLGSVLVGFGAPDDLRVVAVEPVGVRALIDVATGTGDFIVEGVVSHNRDVPSAGDANIRSCAGAT